MKIMNMELGADAVEPQSQSLLKPVTAMDVQQVLRSLGVKKVCLSKVKPSQPGLVPIPKDMITNDVESADLLLIKCIHAGEDHSYSPLSASDGDIPIPTLKWTLAESLNLRVLNGKILLDWYQSRKVPNLLSAKYKTAVISSENNQIIKPDPNPDHLFAGWSFAILNFQEPEFTEDVLVRIIENTGGRMLPSVESVKAVSCGEARVLGDGFLDGENGGAKVLCPAYVVQCVQQGRILPETDYIYVTPR